MVDETRRKILKTGAAAAAMATVPSALAQQNNQATPAGKFYEKAKVRVHYQEWGSGFPLMLISGGGLGGSKIEGLTNPFDSVAEFKTDYRCIGADLRTSTGQSSGPLEIDRPWDMFADDQIGLMDHLGIDKFMVRDPADPIVSARTSNNRGHSLTAKRATRVAAEPVGSVGLNRAWREVCVRST